MLHVTFVVVCDRPPEKRKVGGSTPPLTTIFPFLGSLYLWGIVGILGLCTLSNVLLAAFWLYV